MKKSLYGVIILVCAMLVQEVRSASAFPEIDDIKMRGADSEFIRLHDLPAQRLLDPWDTYEIFSLMAESLNVVASSTYSAVSVAKIPISKAKIKTCTDFLTLVYPSTVGQALARQKTYEYFSDFLHEQSTDLDLLANEVGMFSDILIEGGAGKHPVRKELLEFKFAILFVSRYLADLFLKEWPEVSSYPGLASVLEAKGPTKTMKEARNKWKLARLLHKMISDLRNAVFYQVRVIGEELVLSIDQTQFEIERDASMGALIDDLSLFGMAQKEGAHSILKPSGGAAAKKLPKTTFFGRVCHRPIKKEVKFNLSKNKKYEPVKKYRSTPKRKGKRVRVAG